MEHPLRPTLADRAFLFDDPGAYLAGVDAALRAMVEFDADSIDSDERPVVHQSGTSR